MLTVYKYPLEITDRQTVTMPLAARILSVANQNGSLCLWAEVETNHDPGPRLIEIVGTGNRIPETSIGCRQFIGTAIVGFFVWHVWEII